MKPERVYRDKRSTSKCILLYINNCVSVQLCNIFCLLLHVCTFATVKSQLVSYHSLIITPYMVQISQILHLSQALHSCLVQMLSMAELSCKFMQGKLFKILFFCINTVRPCILYQKGEVPSCYSYCCSSVTLRVPPLDSEMGWTGELWSKTNLLNWEN